ncbi:RrF2 family transcriptional regulator [Nonomuraea rubra]|uniref:RrF2 family transcriptional regulator n=1 Tax=Nonomuraea rubra TaxID=46180 RepID=UPI0033E8AB49
MTYPLTLTQAIAVVVYIAVKVEEGFTDFISTRELAAALGIAPPTATKIVQSLTRAGLVETREGAKGGIRLARPSEKITLLDVLHAGEQDRPLFRTDLAHTLTGGRPDVIRRRVAENLRQAEDAMKASLAGTTIADLHRNT